MGRRRLMVAVADSSRKAKLVRILEAMNCLY